MRRVHSNSAVRLCLCVLVLFVPGGAGKDCTLKTQCSCAMDDGSGTVDLTSLGHSDNTPAFKDVLCSDEGYYYSYNPCGGFTEAECEDAATCVLNEDKSESQQVGDNGKAAYTFDEDAGNAIVAYTSGTGVLKLTQVNLICDKTACDPVLTAQGEQRPGQFGLTLTTICACPGMCTASGPKSCSSAGGISGGISGGSIFTILLFECLAIYSVAGILLSLCLLFTCLVIYFVAGVLLSKFVRKKEGKEIVPNYVFWRSLPVLIKTGFMFTLGLCVPKFKKTSYAEI